MILSTKSINSILFLTCLILVNLYDLILTSKTKKNLRLPSLANVVRKFLNLNSLQIYQITNKETNQCITSLSKGPLKLQPCNQSKNQLWYNINVEGPFEIVNLANNMVIENSLGKHDENNIVLSSPPSNKTLTQRYYEISSKTNPGYFNFKNIDSNKCISYKPIVNNNSTLVQLRCDKNSNSQLFKLEKFVNQMEDNDPDLSDGNLEIVNKANNFCVTTDGEKGMIFEKCNGTSKQLWTNTLKEDSYEIQNQENNNVFTNFNGSSTDNNIVHNLPINDSTAQRYVEFASTVKPGFYLFKNKETNKCITFKSENQVNSQIIQLPCDHNNDFQLFSIKKYNAVHTQPEKNNPNLTDSSLEIVSKANNFCITTGGEMGMLLDKCNGTNKQHWNNTLKNDSYEIQNEENKMVFNNLYGDDENNNIVHNWPINNSTAQRYIEFVSSTKPGFYLFKNVESNKCITFRPNNQINSQLVQFPCDDNNDFQLFSFRKNNDNQSQSTLINIINKSSGKCVTSVGNQGMVLNECKEQKNQVWRNIKKGADVFEIQNVLNNLMFENHLNKTDDNNMAQNSPANNMTSQKYLEIPSLTNPGYYQFKNVDSNKCITFKPENIVANQLVQFPCDPNDQNQLFNFKNFEKKKEKNKRVSNSDTSSNKTDNSTEKDSSESSKKVDPLSLLGTITGCIGALSGGAAIGLGMKSNKPPEEVKEELTENEPLIQEEVKEELITIKGCVKNAINNQKLADSELVDVKLTFVNVKTKKSYTAEINNSIYSVSFTVGNYDLAVTSKKFIGSTSQHEYLGNSDETNLSNDIFLSEVIEGWRFVLSWGNLPKDLDLTLETSEKETIDFNKQQSNDGNIKLDCDCRDGYGPECITLKKVTSEKIYVYVVNYTKDALLSDSKGKLKVYNLSSVIADLEVPKGETDESKTNWFVGVLDKNNKFTTVNKIVSEIPK